MKYYHLILSLVLFSKSYASFSTLQIDDLQKHFQVLKNTNDPEKLYDTIEKINYIYSTSTTLDSSCMDDSASQIVYLATGRIISFTDAFRVNRLYPLDHAKILDEIVGIENLDIPHQLEDIDIMLSRVNPEINYNAINLYEFIHTARSLKEKHMIYVNAASFTRSREWFNHQFVVLKIGQSLFVLNNQDDVFKEGFGTMQPLMSFLQTIRGYIDLEEIKFTPYIVKTPICSLDYCLNNY